MKDNQVLRVIDRLEPSPPIVAVREDIELGKVLAMVWRRKWVVAATVIALTVPAVLYTRQLIPQYAANALIMIENRAPEIVNFQAVVGGFSMDSTTIQSEIEVLRSRGIAQKVINRLRLNDDPEFNPSLKPPEPSSAISVLQTQVIEWLGTLWEWLAALIEEAPEQTLAEQEPSKERLLAKLRADTLERFLSRLVVVPKEQSRAISLKFTSENPETAALVTNTLVDQYIYEQREAKFEATRGASAWLSKRIAELKEKVKASEGAVEEFRQRSELLSGSKGATLTSQQTFEMNTELTRAAAARAETESRLYQVNKLLSSGGNIEAVLDVLQSPLIQQLRRQQVEIELKLAELSKRYLIRHPHRAGLEARAAELQTTIDAEVRNIAERLKNEVSIARVRESSLQKNMNLLKQRAGKANTASVTLHALEREAEANRALLTSFLSRFKETSSQEDIDLHQANARIISYADIPGYPIPSRKRAIIAVTLVGSAFIGVLLTAFIERRQTGFRSGVEIEQTTGVSALGLVPTLNWSDRARNAPISYVLDHPRSAFAESIRSLHTNIILSKVHEPPKKILIASAQPGEGKSTIAISLARMQALAGQKVLLVDADTHKPVIHSALGMQRHPGLVDLLTGRASLKEVVQIDDASGLFVIAVGSPTLNAPAILASNNMSRALDALTNTYDLIIVDSPPLIPVSDARILSRQVDTTVFVLRWASTKQEVARVALKQIVSGGGHLAGVLLTMVDLKKNARYSYGDSGFYLDSGSRYNAA